MKKLDIPDADVLLLRLTTATPSPDNRPVPIAEAIARLGEAETIKAFYNPKPDVFLPVFWPRMTLIGRFYKDGVYDAGPAAMGLGYTLCLLNLDGTAREHLFIEAAPPTRSHDTMTLEQIARMCHDVNRGYCRAFGDATQLAWDDAPDWQKAAAIEGVRFQLAHPDATPEESHANWTAQKVADGWKYGFVKDAEKKEHPCLVAYGDLPVAQRAKDYLFVAVVTSCAAIMGVSAATKMPPAPPEFPPVLDREAD